MTKIELKDSTEDVMRKMSEGNPGALNVCLQLLEKGSDIDPDAFGGGLMPILHLDANKVYSSRIWMLYQDVCGENLVHMCAVLRALQLGFLTRGQLDYAIDNRGQGIDCDSVLSQVRQRLPNFAAHLLEVMPKIGDVKRKQFREQL